MDESISRVIRHRFVHLFVNCGNSTFKVKVTPCRKGEHNYWRISPSGSDCTKAIFPIEKILTITTCCSRACVRVRDSFVYIWGIERAIEPIMNLDNDLDQHLLHQFSCLGTTDKDDLVKQLQKLLAGSQLNEATATFFLDMNNWNLQAAICSYFDCESPVQNKYPCMRLVCDSTIGEGESVPPLTNFRKSWQIQNSGTEAWPEGICLQYTGGVQMGVCTRVPVPSLGPKESTEVSVDLQSPPHCGIFESKWRMMVKSTETFFGDDIWIIITVSESGTLAITQQLHQLTTSSSNDVKMC